MANREYTAADIPALRRKRTLAFNRLTKAYNIALEVEEDATLLDLFCTYAAEIQAHVSLFEGAHLAILGLVDENDVDRNIQENFDEMYHKVLSIHRRYGNFNTDSSGKIVPKVEPSHVKLPKISLPHFAGNVKEWAEFIDMFNVLIHRNSTLSSSEKFRYLYSSLSGDALKIIKGFPLTGEHYHDAYQALTLRYKNNRLLAFTCWRDILNVNLKISNPHEFRRSLDSIEENLCILNKLSLNHWDFVLIYNILSKLDIKLRRDFEELHADEAMPTYFDLKHFLNARCEALLRDSHFSESHRDSNNRSFSQSISKPRTQSLLAPNEHPGQQEHSSASLTCPYCTENHSITKCQKFRENSLDERIDIAKNKKWCFNCLKPSHQLRQCNSFFRCLKCKRKHHTLLHNDNVECEKEIDTESNSVVMVTKDIITKSQDHNTLVLLATAIIDIQGIDGEFKSIRAIFDTGSQSNFITSSAARALGLKTTLTSHDVLGIGGTRSKLTRTVSCSIGTDKKHVFSISMFVIDHICSNQPPIELEIPQWAKRHSSKLADPHFFLPGPIDVLLNADTFAQLTTTKIIKGTMTQPAAFDSSFGYLAIGRASVAQSKSLVTLCNLQVNITSLNEAIQKFWAVDEVPKACSYSLEDRQCEQHYQNTHSRDGTGRYVVYLPFKNNEEPTFYNSRDIALRRFHSIEKRLSREPALQDLYTEFMTDYLKSGHMSEVSAKDVGVGKYYIPHHCVLRPDSVTTKIRVVFDASAKDNRFCSLNDTILTGPKLQANIFDILLRFRMHAIVFMADIRQMYRQVVLAEDHRDYQRILWRSKITNPIREYRLNTVTYGVTASPFLACRSINQLIQDEGNGFPVASKVLSRDMFVDDIVTGFNTLSEACLAKSEISQLCQLGQFELRKWASNNFDLLKDLQKDHCLQQPLSFDTDSQSSSTLKVLGLKWDPVSDCFTYSITPMNFNCTKRIILSELARIFDPLGFLSPVSIIPKYLIQKLWIQGLGWDEQPPQDISNTWTDYTSQLIHLDKLQLPRHALPSKESTIELHGFCDSSEIAYGAVVYLKCYDNLTRNVTTHFLCSKARVAPIKKISLPRLELCGALLLANLTKSITETLADELQVKQTYMWTDSTIVLSWLRCHSSRWTTFVANRVSIIQDIVPAECWRHVASAENPADLCSRGLSPVQLMQSDLWWQGPKWLLQENNEWPNSTVEKPETILEEKCPKLVTLLNNDSPPEFIIEDLFRRFSNLDKILRIISYILKFCRLNKRSPKSNPACVTESDRQTSLQLVIRHFQQSFFKTEMVKIQSNLPLPKSFRKLNPFIDKTGLLRVGGRLARSGLEYDHKHPVMLPQNSILTQRIVEHVHNNNSHPGINTTLYLVQNRFWIIAAKRIIRRILSKCIRCYRVRPQSLQPFMSDLPAFRINQIKPFSKVGVDFGGPFKIKFHSGRGAKTDKAYLCLFVCLATKAVHIETVSSLSAEAFIAALRRFVSRCSKIYSDCGTNFVGARNIIVSYMQQAANQEAIEFIFNPPSAPHFGGVWEIQIKAAKTLLYRVVGDQVLTFEELSTLFIQIEATLNSRPLSPISTDPNDISALTPGHFLTLEPLAAVADEDLITMNIHRLKRWQLIQAFNQHFWIRWKNEYLHNLTQRAKWTSDSKPLAINDLVIIKDDIRTPLHWPLARVIALHPGPDGIVRVASIKTANAHIIKRPLVKLCPLPNAN